MNAAHESVVYLSFPLEVEDDWPPVAVEALPFKATPAGLVALVPPIFVGGLSVGDVIKVELEPDTDRVMTWAHVASSGNTTVWLLRTGPSDTIEPVLDRLRTLGCNTVGLEGVGAFSVDVPESIEMSAVDSILEGLDSDSVAVAFPSLRHETD